MTTSQKTIIFSVLVIIPSLNFSMHQLARPALTQASGTITAIAPQLQSKLRHCVTNSSTPQPTLEIENKTAKINPEDLAKLFQHLLDEQKKQTVLLEEIKNQDNSFFAPSISKKTLLWFTMCCVIFNIPSGFYGIKEKLHGTNNQLSNVDYKLGTTNDKLDTMNKTLKEIKDKNKI